MTTDPVQEARFANSFWILAIGLLILGLLNLLVNPDFPAPVQASTSSGQCQAQ